MMRRIAVLVVTVVVVGGLLSAGEKAEQSEEPKEDYYELHKLLVDTLNQVERNYVKEISRRQLIEAAIKGVLRELDPYSAYISPKDLGHFRAAVEGNFGGIGIQIGVDHGRLKVLSPLVGTPAYRAGILAGDQIVEINGQHTKGITLEEAVRRLKGEPGTQVALKVIHPGNTEPDEITLTRELIRVETVLGDHRKEDDRWDFILDPEKQIGYVRITAFSRDTPQELRKALSELTTDHLRGLILDLRFNPGGLLKSAIDVSDLFVSEGTIVSTSGRTSPKRTWLAHKEGTFEGFPLVILVNRYSASASEIVAGCLQDHGRAVIMGERTWGKGSVQNVIPLEHDRSALKLTTASYLRPSGKNIHRFADADDDDQWGVRPDGGYELKLTDEEMLALVKDRRLRDILRPRQPEPVEAVESGSQPAPDEQAADQESAEPDESAHSEPPREETTADPPGEPAARDPPPSPPEAPECVDFQLRMAIDYLSAELARAE